MGVDVGQAYEWIGRYHEDVMKEFLVLYEGLPWFEGESDPTNIELREYVYGEGDWVRVNEAWSVEVSVDRPGFDNCPRRRLRCQPPVQGP